MTAAVLPEDELVRVPAQIQRDHYGRPLIQPPGGGKAKAYTRVTTLAGTLDDTFKVEQWKLRHAVMGLVHAPDLIHAVAAYRDTFTEPASKAALNALAEQAMAAAGADDAREYGTAFHAASERHDTGQPGDPDALARWPEMARDLRAYEQAMRGLKIEAVEQFVVLDGVQAAGTLDRILLIDGERYIADIKTGSLYGQGKMALQLALYAHGMVYDPATHQRSPLPGVSGERGLIIHVPRGEGVAALHWIELREAWQMVPLAKAARAWRTRRNLMQPFNDAAALANLAEGGLIEDPIGAQIAAAPTVDALNALWHQYATTGWTAEHTAQAAARKAALS